MCGINSSCPQRCLYDMEMTSVSVRRDAKPPNENVIIRAIHVQAFWGLGLRCELRKADESLWEAVIYNAPVAWQGYGSFQQPLIISWK